MQATVELLLFSLCMARSSLKLYSRGRFGCAVIEHSVDTLYFVDNAVCNLRENFPRKLCAVGSHEVGGIDGTEDYGVIVCTLISHDSDRTHICKSCEVLSKTLVAACLCDFFTIDVIRILYYSDFICCDITNNSYSKSWFRERLTECISRYSVHHTE